MHTYISSKKDNFIAASSRTKQDVDMIDGCVKNVRLLCTHIILLRGTLTSALCTYTEGLFFLFSFHSQTYIIHPFLRLEGHS